MRFRPCIDLRNGKVVQIVGGTLEGAHDALITNFETERAPADYARMYQADGLAGGHVIALGSGNREAALAALRAFPGGMHMGGGITPDNAREYLDAGASHVIVTSYVFRDGRVDAERLQRMLDAVGRERLVLDLSCRKKDETYWVVTDRWQRFSELAITPDTLAQLAAVLSPQRVIEVNKYAALVLIVLRLVRQNIPARDAPPTPAAPAQPKETP